jgi:hypothetical protein
MLYLNRFESICSSDYVDLCQYCVRLSVSALTTHLHAQHKLHPDVRPRDSTWSATCVAQLFRKEPDFGA